MSIQFDHTRNGFSRRIVAIKAGAYAWTIKDDLGTLIAWGTEGTLADARRIVRSTTNFLAR